MDKKLSNKKNRINPLFYSILLISIVLLLIALTNLDQKSTFEISASEVIISEVTRSDFASALNFQGTIDAQESTIIDARESGSVKAIFVKSGETVDIGDTILTLENTNLELEVLQRESQLYEQINNQQQTKLLLNQNDLNQKDQLKQVNYQIALQKPRYERASILYKEGAVARQEFEEVSSTYFYQLSRLSLLKEVYKNDSLAKEVELKQINSSKRRILKNLTAVKKIMDRLIVRANKKGRLGDFNLQIGQVINQGYRIGEIYDLSVPVINAQIDELYINSISEDTKGTTTINGIEFNIKVDRIIPTITSGNFEVELSFTDDKPKNLNKGQTVRIQLFLDGEKNSIVLPVGQFYNSTGGSWVLKIDGNEAMKTRIQLGDKNADYYEVINGLLPGEKVITSSYNKFQEFDKIKFK